MRHAIASVFFLLLTLGCSSPDNSLPYPLIIREEGLGAIHADMPFDLIQSSLNGFTFEKLSQITPDHPEIILQVKRGNSVLAQIISDRSGQKISAIIIVSPLIKNRHNEGLTDPLKAKTPLSCHQGICFYTDEPSIRYKLDPVTQTVREITYQKL